MKELEKFEKIKEYDGVYSSDQEKGIGVSCLLSMMVKEKNPMKLYYLAKQCEIIFSEVRITDEEYIELMKWTEKIKKAEYKDVLLYVRGFLKDNPLVYFSHPFSRNKCMKFIIQQFIVQSLIRGYRTGITEKKYKKFFDKEVAPLPIEMFIQVELEKLKREQGEVQE